jgi:hypothetical protein
MRGDPAGRPYVLPKRILHRQGRFENRPCD